MLFSLVQPCKAKSVPDPLRKLARVSPCRRFATCCVLGFSYFARCSRVVFWANALFPAPSLRPCIFALCLRPNAFTSFSDPGSHFRIRDIIFGSRIQAPELRIQGSELHEGFRTTGGMGPFRQRHPRFDTMPWQSHAPTCVLLRGLGGMPKRNTIPRARKALLRKGLSKILCFSKVPDS